MKFLLIFISLLLAMPAAAATSEWIGSNSDFNGSNNWTAGVPTDVAVFNNVNRRNIGIFVTHALTQMTFNSGASVYSFTIYPPTGYLRLYGAGIVNNSQVAPTFNNYGGFEFRNFAGAGNAAITNNGGLYFFESSTADHAVIINKGNAITTFNSNSTAGESTITNEGGVELYCYRHPRPGMSSLPIVTQVPRRYLTVPVPGMRSLQMMMGE